MTGSWCYAVDTSTDTRTWHATSSVLFREDGQVLLPCPLMHPAHTAGSPVSVCVLMNRLSKLKCQCEGGGFCKQDRVAPQVLLLARCRCYCLTQDTLCSQLYTEHNMHTLVLMHAYWKRWTVTSIVPRRLPVNFPRLSFRV